jgi:hypothetical protein
MERSVWYHVSVSFPEGIKYCLVKVYVGSISYIYIYMVYRSVSGEFYFSCYANTTQVGDLYEAQNYIANFSPRMLS